MIAIFREYCKYHLMISLKIFSAISFTFIMRVFLASDYAISAFGYLAAMRSVNGQTIDADDKLAQFRYSLFHFLILG